MKRIVHFAMVGGIGFVADAAVLALLIATTTLGPFVSRLASIGFALTVTWLVNRSVTFGPSGRSIAAEGARYGGVGIATSIINYLIYCGLLIVLPGLPVLAAMVVASLCAMSVSYLGYSRLVFDR